MHIIFVKLGNLHNSAAKLLQIFHICKHSGIFFEKKAIYCEFVRTERLLGACSRIVVLWPDKQGHQSRFHKKTDCFELCKKTCTIQYKERWREKMHKKCAFSGFIFAHMQKKQ
jgi:hypothetical protein